MDNAFDYKQTVNLPKTDFSMKANLPQNEPLILEKWRQQDIYNAILSRRKNARRYVLHDGPPYANGNIHIGHALNKILKDIIVKYKTLRGYSAPYVPGWDCHGLPVEHQLFKELKKRKDEVEQVEFREKAHDFAMKFVDIQKEEFKRLGVFADWDNPYLTLAPKYEAAIIRAFGALVKKGYIYKGTKPVNWCCSCETALAEAEVEYEDHTSASIFVKFPVPHKGTIAGVKLPPGANAFIVIWTTTPWTLMGNVAAAVHPDYTYVFAGIGKDVLILEKNLCAGVLEKSGITDYENIGEARGSKLEHLEYTHPMELRSGKVVLADYVSSEDGSGIVHTAPGYGSEDFQTGKRYDLEVLMQVDDKGCFYKDIPLVGGMVTPKAGKVIMEYLREKNILLSAGQINHSYPHCWRCKQPIIFRATEQWFMNVEHNGLRNKLLEVIKKVNWVPAFGENRIAAMVENRPDWCLSRQRLWGVPIPVFYCSHCRAAVLDGAAIEHVAKIVETEGTNSWFIRPAKELLPKGYVCRHCKKNEFVKEKDILDVWFDSGVSHQAVIKANTMLQYPADLYLEGSDQHRGWFQAALITAMAIDDCAPFNEVLTHGFTVDGEGRKMSKSRGNVIAPQQVIGKLGADVLRLCIASSDYNDDVRMSEEILARVSESYRKIRNTLKYALGNLFDFDPGQNTVPYKELLEIDRWALSELHALVKQVTIAYDKFVFHQAVKLVYNFCVVQMSSFYLDVLKDRLYTFAPDSPQRRSAQTVLHEILTTIIALTSPVLSFTAEEAYGFSKGRKEDSIFLTAWPQLHEEYISKELNSTWKFLLDVRNCVLKSLEESRGAKLIGNSLEAKVVLSCPASAPHMSELLRRYREQLPAVFIVSEVVLDNDIDTAELPRYNIDLLKDDNPFESGQLFVKVDRASGSKCVRCWNYSPSVGLNKQHPALCGRCCDNIR